MCKLLAFCCGTLLITSTQFIQWYNLFDLPRENDPLHLNQFFAKACNLLDECFRQTIGGPSSMPIHLAAAIDGYMPRTLRQLGDIYNTPDQQRLRRFVDEHSYLIRIHKKVKDKYVLGYSVPNWLRGFFFDPNRSGYLYSTSLVIERYQKAIKTLTLDTNPDSYKNNGPVYFFTPTLTPSGEIPIGNITNPIYGSDRQELLLFLQSLSEIHWFDIYNRGWDQRHFTNRIVHWVHQENAF